MVLLIAIGSVANNKQATTSTASDAGKSQTAAPAPATVKASPAATTQAQAAATTTAAAVPASSAGAPSVSKQAVRYVQKAGTDALAVQTDVTAVEVGIQLLAKDPSSIDQAAIDQLAQLAQQGHDDLANRKDALAVASDGTGRIADLEAEAFAGAQDLTKALDALVTYTGEPNAATLARFSTQFSNAKAEWNDAITQLWAAAGAAKPPTV